MSITKRKGIGGVSALRQLAKAGEQVINRSDLDPSSRNGRRIMARLRAKYGDEAIDFEIQKIQQLKMEE
jgi:hypothetical protein